jgi:hypothetical protein
LRTLIWAGRRPPAGRIEAFPDADFPLLLRAGLQELVPSRDPTLVAQVVDAAMTIARNGGSAVLAQTEH